MLIVMSGLLNPYVKSCFLVLFYHSSFVFFQISTIIDIFLVGIVFYSVNPTFCLLDFDFISIITKIKKWKRESAYLNRPHSFPP